jgi:phosphate transport system substrate-binding protein
MGGLTHCRARLRLGLAALAAALALPAPAHAATLSFSGAPAAGAVVADLAYFYRHAVKRPPRFSIVGGTAGSGIADVARGIVDGGLTSRPPTADDPPGLVVTPFALSGICLVTNVANRLPDLTRAQLQGLVSGSVTSWSQVPGSARTDAITPVAFDRSAGAAVVFLSTFVDLGTTVGYDPRTFFAPGDVRDFIEATPSAWGYVDLVFARGLHAVPYQGVPCSRASIRARTYPALSPLGFVTRGRPRGALGRFVRWATHSATARRVIATRYVLPG